MTEYLDRVKRQRLVLEAEEWAKGIESLHTHSITSMHYETAASKADIEENGMVTDTTYNSGLVKRTRGGKFVCYLGNELTGDELLMAYYRAT